MHSPLSAGGALGEGELTEPLFLEGVAGNEGVACNFYVKNKLKSETFHDKKSYKQKCFCLSTKNSNWEILTENFVIFKF